MKGGIEGRGSEYSCGNGIGGHAILYSSQEGAARTDGWLPRRAQCGGCVVGRTPRPLSRHALVWNLEHMQLGISFCDSVFVNPVLGPCFVWTGSKSSSQLAMTRDFQWFGISLTIVMNARTVKGRPQIMASCRVIIRILPAAA